LIDNTWKSLVVVYLQNYKINYRKPDWQPSKMRDELEKVGLLSEDCTSKKEWDEYVPSFC
jgi:hypothetical protein